MIKQSSFRNSCMAIFCPTEHKNMQNWNQTKYMISGIETCPNTGKIHFQTYVEFKFQKQLKTLKNMFPTTHFEARKGTQQEAVQYCKKDGQYTEIGELILNKPGKRTDLENAASIIETGGSLSDVAVQFPICYIKYNKGLTSYKNTITLMNDRPEPNVEIHYGDSNTGKSTQCKTRFPNCYKVPKPSKDGTLWFDGYDNHDTIWLDEFDGSWMKLNMFKQLTDSSRMPVQIKGGFVNMNAKNIIICMNSDPNTMYKPKNPADFEAIARRISKLFRYTKNDNKVTITKEFELFNLPIGKRTNIDFGEIDYSIYD